MITVLLMAVLEQLWDATAVAKVAYGLMVMGYVHFKSAYVDAGMEKCTFYSER